MGRRTAHLRRLEAVLAAAEGNSFDELAWYFQNWGGLGLETDAAGNNPLHRAALGGAEAAEAPPMGMGGVIQCKLVAKRSLHVSA